MSLDEKKTDGSQRKRGWRTPLAVTTLACALVGGAIVWFSLPEPGSSTGPLPSEEDVGIDPSFGTTIPGHLEFYNETGQRVRLEEFLGDKPTILTPVYFECPMLCNLTMDGLVRGLRGLSADIGADFSAITLSFDPREGPQLASAAKHTALDRYGRDGAAASWHFLTGEQDAIQELMDAIGFRYKFDEQRGQYMHAAGLYVLSPGGEISRFLGGVEFAPRDLQLALTEAAAGRHSNLRDKILLFCFHYDPTQGKYGLAILRLLRFAGILTVTLLVTGIVWMNRLHAQSHPGHTPADPSSGGAT